MNFGRTQRMDCFFPGTSLRKENVRMDGGFDSLVCVDVGALLVLAKYLFAPLNRPLYSSFQTRIYRSNLFTFSTSLTVGFLDRTEWILFFGVIFFFGLDFVSKRLFFT